MQYLIIFAGLFWLFDSLKPYFPAIAGISAIALIFWLIQKKSEKEKRTTQEAYVINRLLDELQASHPMFSEEKMYNDERSEIISAFESRDNVEVISIIQSRLSNIVIYEFVDQHYQALKKDYKRHVRTDAYGIDDEKAWLKVLEGIVKAKLYHEFIEKVTSYQLDLPEYEFYILDGDTKREKEEIQDLAQGISDYFKIEYDYREDGTTETSEVDFDSITDGHAYEDAVAELINQSLEDWQAEVTQGSGDQGVDIIAEHDSGMTVAIQCKLYSQPVGNKAVQEIMAGRIHYDADIAFVVSNNRYTKSAIELAASGNVELLHHDMLIEELSSLTENVIEVF